MCGIAGWAGPVKPNRAKALVPLVQRSLRHRGPDASGSRILDQAVLIHTRLSIIDLSPNGSQPMCNEDGTIWTIFNGEIYNHLVLKRALEQRGHHFRGRSDTEVIPHLYEEYGPQFAEQLRGMFAIAVWDTRTQTLVLARDRFGIKPLYYAKNSDLLLFGSEIKALLSTGLLNREVDWQALFDYLSFFVVPEPATAYCAVRALEPGYIAIYHRGQLQLSQYHKWKIKNECDNINSAIERAGELLDQGVRQQLLADVPIGVLLSGGIDSSLVAESYQRQLQGTAKTFNVKHSDPEFDESWAAKLVAKNIESEHVTFNMPSNSGSWSQVADLLKHFDQPFADSSLVPTFAIFNLIRERYKVVLSGDGGDEGFGGYTTFTYLLHVMRAKKWGGVAPLITTVVEKLLSQSGFGRKLKRFSKLIQANEQGTLFQLLAWMQEEEKLLLAPELARDYLKSDRLLEPQWNIEVFPNTNPLDKMMARLTELMTRLYLQSDYLRKVDMMSMRCSLEVRVPMLDEELFAFGLSLPYYLRTDGKYAKRVLRSLAAQRLPLSIAKKNKRGFSIPLDQWLKEQDRIEIRDQIMDGLGRQLIPLNEGLIATWLQAFKFGKQLPNVSRMGLYQRVLMLWSLIGWLETEN